MRTKANPTILRNLARRLWPDSTHCPNCDLSVGFVCEMCEAANQLVLAARTIEDDKAVKEQLLAACKAALSDDDDLGMSHETVLQLRTVTRAVTRDVTKEKAALPPKLEPPQESEDRPTAKAMKTMNAETVANSLDRLAIDMRGVAYSMEQINGLTQRDQKRCIAHAKELYGAADMAREWAKHLRVGN